MKVPTTALMSVVLVLTAFSAMSKPTFDVVVTNFPLDEQGKLKVSSDGVTSKVVTVFKDLNLSWTDTYGDSGYYTVDLEGYNEFVVYASFRNWTVDSLIFYVDVKFVVDDIEAYPEKQEEYISLQIWFPYTDSPERRSALYHVRGPEIKLFVSAQPREPPADGWALVSVSLYLRN